MVRPCFCLSCFASTHGLIMKNATKKQDGRAMVKSNGMVTPSPKRHRCAKMTIVKLSPSQIGADRAGSDPGCDRDSCDRWRQPCQSVVPADCRPDSCVGKPRGLPAWSFEYDTAYCRGMRGGRNAKNRRRRAGEANISQVGIKPACNGSQDLWNSGGFSTP